MEGIVQVVNVTGSNIPSFAVDELGNRIEVFPLYNLTDDGKVEIGLSWTPDSIVTNEPISFIMDFFEYPENSRLHLWPYNFVIMQNGTEFIELTKLHKLVRLFRHILFLYLEKLLLELKVAKIRVHLSNLALWSIKIHMAIQGAYKTCLIIHSD